MSTVKLTKWGNSVGIRIPASLMKEAHLVAGEELEMRVNKTGVLTLTPIKNQQEGWLNLFNAAADDPYDKPLLTITNEFDEEEWTW